MKARIRPAVVADAAAIVSLGREIDRDQLATADSFRALLERPAESTTERLVAELDGRIIAWAPSGAYESRDGWLWIGVERSARRSGLGTAPARVTPTAAARPVVESYAKRL